MYYTFSKDYYRKAAKQHRCENCWTHIEKNESHFVNVTKLDNGEFFQYRLHLDCKKAHDKYQEYILEHVSMSDIMNSGGFSWMHEEAPSDLTWLCEEFPSVAKRLRIDSETQS